MCMMRTLALAALALSLAAMSGVAGAVLPPPVARAFADQRIPLAAVSVYVQELGATQPAVSHQPGRPMSPASTMKLVTTFAGLELLGPEYRWKTEAYADGRIDGGVLRGQSGAQRLRRSENHRRAIPGVDRAAEGDRAYRRYAVI